MAETITVRNESMVAAGGRLTIDLDGDFRDVLRSPAGSPEPDIEVRWEESSARLEWIATYRHADREDIRGLAVTVDPAPSDLEAAETDAPHARRLAFDLELEPHGERSIQLTFASLVDGAWRQPADARQLARSWRSGGGPSGRAS